MPTAATLAPRQRVAAGAVWLDETNPDWWRHIDLDRLDLVDACLCVLGQLHGNYWQATALHWNTRESDAARLGFTAYPVGDGMDEFNELEAAWRDAVTDRRDTDGQPDD